MKSKQIEVVLDDDYLPVALDLISKAKKSLDLMAFSFAIGSMAGKHNVKSTPYVLAQHIVSVKKKRKNLRVRLYIEGERDTADRNQVTTRFLEQAGVEIVFGATHAKGFCVDERFLLFGSTNWTHQSITKNYEANLLFDDREIAAGFLVYYEHLWEGGRHGEISLDPPFFADGDFLPMLIELIDGAKKKIDFAIYFFDQRDIEKALLRAHVRGVKIRGFVHRHKSFALSYVMRNYATVRRLRAAGLDDLHFGPPFTFSHSKYLVADGKKVAIGTGNWLDEDVEIHPQLYIELTDARVAKALMRHLDRQISKV